MMHSLYKSNEFFKMYEMFLNYGWPSNENDRIVVKMRVSVSSSKEATESMLVCRRKRGVMSLLSAAMLNR